MSMPCGSVCSTTRAPAGHSKRETAVLVARLERDKAHMADGHTSIFGLLRSALGWSDAECRSRTQLRGW